MSRIAPLAVALMSDAAAYVSGQIFGVRNNEISFFSQSRPIVTAHTEAVWTPDSVIERVLPAMRPSFYPLVRSGEVFSWAPV